MKRNFLCGRGTRGMRVRASACRRGIALSPEVRIMSNPASPNFFSRVLSSDPFRKGLAAAIAGAIVGLVSEALWPTTEG